MFNFLTVFLIYRVFHDYTTSRCDSQGHSEKEVQYQHGYSISVVAVLCIGQVEGNFKYNQLFIGHSVFFFF